MFSETYASFILWTQHVAADLARRTNNTVQLNSNLLAASMTACLPQAPENININMLKFNMDASGSASPTAFLDSLTLNYLKEFLLENITEITDAWCQSQDGKTVFEVIEQNLDLDMGWEQLNDPDDETLSQVAHAWLQLPLDTQKAYTDTHYRDVTQRPRITFEYVQTYVLGRAYQDYLKDELCSLLSTPSLTKDPAVFPEALCAHGQFSFPVQPIASTL